MNLFKIFANIEYVGDIDDCEIKTLETNSSKCEKGCVFFCISGSNTDGHNYANIALDKGAHYIVCERDLGIENQIIVKDTKKAFALASCNFFENPSHKLKMIGVTGTNGKTSCTYIIKHILEKNGFKVGLIGTIKNQIGDVDLPSKYTTPQSFELNEILNAMVKGGCEYVVMEVSSHALDQERVFGIQFNTAIFTNLTQDHLDYHETMDNYFKAKSKIFDIASNCVLNLDDSYGKSLYGKYKDKCSTFSIDDLSGDIIAKNIKYTASDITFEAIFKTDIKRVYFNMPGQFSVYNCMASIVAASLQGISLENIINALKSFNGLLGRAEVLYKGDFTIICDYAHTADGLRAFLQSIKPYVDGRLIALFGCAGERDSSKRFEMGQTVGEIADFIILTSDNPRKEDPLEIIKHTETGIKATKTKYKSFADRYGAILWGIDNIKNGDVLCLLGKGHEDYQVLYSSTIYFDEHEIVKNILKDKGLI